MTQQKAVISSTVKNIRDELLLTDTFIRDDGQQTQPIDTNIHNCQILFPLLVECWHFISALVYVNKDCMAQNVTTNKIPL